MPSGEGQPSPAPSKRLNVSRTVEAAMPSRRAISRVEIPAENFKRMISRTWRIATLSAGIIAPLDCQRRDPKQASGGARRHSRPRAALFRSGGRHHLVMVGGAVEIAQGVDVQIGRDREDRYDRDRYDRDRRQRFDSDTTVGIGPGGVTVGPRQRCRIETTTIERDGRWITREERRCD